MGLRAESTVRCGREGQECLWAGGVSHLDPVVREAHIVAGISIKAAHRGKGVLSSGSGCCFCGWGSAGQGSGPRHGTGGVLRGLESRVQCWGQIPDSVLRLWGQCGPHRRLYPSPPLAEFRDRACSGLCPEGPRSCPRPLVGALLGCLGPGKRGTPGRQASTAEGGPSAGARPFRTEALGSHVVVLVFSSSPSRASKENGVKKGLEEKRYLHHPVHRYSLL